MQHQVYVCERSKSAEFLYAFEFNLLSALAFSKEIEPIWYVFRDLLGGIGSHN